MTQQQTDDATLKFREALTLAAENLTVDALHAFREVTDSWPEHDLADDALYNVGACYLALNQFQRAAETFDEVLSRYPEATIAAEGNGGRESGPTAAKAWLGLVSARLGLGDLGGAEAAQAEVARYEDAVVRPAPGIERTFAEIGASLIRAATNPLSEADEVTPEQVVDAPDED